MPAADIERVGREFASIRPALVRLGVGAQRHMGAPAAYSTIASLPALTGAWRERGGGCSYIPLATAAAVSEYALQREDLRPGPVRTINMSQVGRALTDPQLDPPVPCFSDGDRELVDALLAGFDEGELRTRGWQKIDLGQGPVPHADGGFGTETGKLALHADYVPPVEVSDTRLAERFPLAMITPKTHLFLNSTFANQRRQHSAQPAPEVVLSPEDALPRGVVDGGRVRVFNERGSFLCAVRVSDDARPGVLVAPMGWWNSDYEGGRSGQATTSQALTELGNAPTFNDNRVEVEPLARRSKARARRALAAQRISP